MKAYFERQISFRGVIIPLVLFVLLTFCYLSKEGLTLVQYSITVLVFIFWMFFFYRMDTSVDDTHLKIVFGFGFYTKNIALAEICSVSCVKLKYQYYIGPGIKIQLRRTLYWARNTDVVELKLKGSKRVIQIGSKDAEQLKQAIEARL